MPRVVPSQVCAFIDTLPNYVNKGAIASMNHLGSGSLNAILDLVDQIPDELLAMDNATYSSFIHAKAYIRDVIQTWIANNSAGHARMRIELPVSRDPVATIQRALSKCPDESPSPATAELKFITHPDLRANLRSDIGAINRALSNGEWKAATVLAGSTIEALMLWDLQNRRTPAQRNAAIATLVTSNVFAKQPPADLDEWGLHQYLEVSAQIPTIEPDTAKEARLAKDFRNLIHPGRAQRLGQKCDRGTALACVAALEHVVRDLS